MTIDSIRMTVSESIQVKQRLLADDGLLDLIKNVAGECIAAYRRGNRVLLAGNGGSAADAQHIAAELVGRYAFERSALPAIALTTDSSMLTAIGNDYGYEEVFKRQLEANGRAGDVFIGISTSGKSSNILSALRRARELRINTVGLTGQDAVGMPQYCDYCLRVPSNSTPRIQEAHIMVGHIICSLVEEALFGRLDRQ